MCDTDDETELARLIDRYVKPDRRYLRVGGGLLHMADGERAEFARKLGEAAGEITPRELDVLLAAGWRERKTAVWLIAVAGRTAFRDRIGELLLASEGPYAGLAYCVALATFGTPADADLLSRYLDRYLPRTDVGYDQAAALGALLCVDAGSGTDRAGRFLVPDGLWQRWTASAAGRRGLDPEALRGFVGELCAIAAGCAVPPGP